MINTSELMRSIESIHSKIEQLSAVSKKSYKLLGGKEAESPQREWTMEMGPPVSEKVRIMWLEAQMDRLRPKVFDKNYFGDEALHENFSKLNDEYKQLTRTVGRYIDELDPEIKAKYPELYSILARGDSDIYVIKNAIRSFERVQKGDISVEKGIEDGMDFTIQHYNLPPDLFDHMRKKLRKG
jgi:hypothetical protein